jgi:mRNA-degrading endonuclease toxin of MazEF toxin-antitoxin module
MSEIVEQYSIWWVKLEDKPVGHEQVNLKGGRRPVFVLSKRDYNIKSETPICFIMSTSDKKSKNRFSVNIPEMPNDISSVNTSQIRTLAISRFDKFIMNATKEQGEEIIAKFLSELVQNEKKD